MLPCMYLEPPAVVKRPMDSHQGILETDAGASMHAAAQLSNLNNASRYGMVATGLTFFFRNTMANMCCAHTSGANPQA